MDLKKTIAEFRCKEKMVPHYFGRYANTNLDTRIGIKVSIYIWIKLMNTLLPPHKCRNITLTKHSPTLKKYNQIHSATLSKWALKYVKVCMYVCMYESKLKIHL
jgi:hypothetical protein